MSIKLVRDTDTYEVEYPQEGSDTPPIFVLRKLSAGKQNWIQDQIILTEGTGRGGGKMRYLSGSATRLKIDYCLTDWKNVLDDTGNPVPCTCDNKAKLPQDIQSWLEEQINKDNHLKGIGEDERKN